MNILILTATFGHGHDAAAKAIKSQISNRRADVNFEVVDFMSYLFPYVYKGIYTGFNYVVRNNLKLFDMMIRADYLSSRFPWREDITNSFAVKKIVNKYNPHLIICTWPMGCRYISAYKKRHEDPIPFVTCITDIAVHPEWITKESDYYLVASKESEAVLLNKGIRKNKIISCGIPIAPAFKKTQVDDGTCGKKRILIMGGGLGLIPGIDSLLNALQKEDNCHVTVIAGQNEELRDYLISTYPGVETLGFTQNVAEYMKKADAVFTKAGGMTMFEAIGTETPIFVFDPVIWNERINADYIQNSGIGRILRTERMGWVEEFVGYISSEDTLEYMKRNIRNIKSAMDSEVIEAIDMIIDRVSLPA